MGEQLALDLEDETPDDLLAKALAFVANNPNITYLVLSDPKNGDLIIANHTGGLKVPYSETASLARSLADHCKDLDERAWVAETWQEDP